MNEKVKKDRKETVERENRMNEVVKNIKRGRTSKIVLSSSPYPKNELVPSK
jgi:hypothetical protein